MGKLNYKLELINVELKEYAIKKIETDFIVARGNFYNLSKMYCILEPSLKRERKKKYFCF